MNEATFEQRIPSEIKRHFPFLTQKDISHQKTFSIKLGHKKYETIGDTVKGRLDVMVEYAGKPLAIIELKAPGIELTDDDFNQCVSYARLTEPMTPLAIISNGEESIIVDTYTKNRVDSIHMKSTETFNSFIKNIGLIAGADLDSSIEILLRSDKKFWNEIVQAINEPVFEKNKSNITDLRFPICDEFQIERSIVRKLLRKMQSESMVILSSDPFSGKTNVVYQLYQLAKTKNESIPIYIDLAEPKSIFQYLSNNFSDFLSTPISKDNFRHWLINSLCKNAKHRIIFILDNIYSSIGTDWKEIYELLEINQNNNFSVLLVMNEQIYDDVKYIKNKNILSTIGKAYHCTLMPLSDDEFGSTLQMIDEKYKLRIYHGGQHNPEYRKPEMLKNMVILASENNKYTNDKSRIFIPSITDTRMLLSDWKNISGNIRSGYREFAKYVIEQKDEIKNPKQRFLIYSSGVLFVSSNNKVLETKYIQDLLAFGYIKKECLNNGMRFLYPVLPNAISVAAAFEIMDILTFQSDDEEIYRTFIECTQLFPYPDLIASLVILLSSREDSSFLSRILDRLIYDIPSIDYSTPKSVLIKTDKGICDIDLSAIDFKDDSGVMLGNTFPWLVLSNLVANPFITEDGDFSLWIQTIMKIGSFENVLLRVGNMPFEEITNFHVHSLPGNIEVICGKMGIIEPITYSIQQGFLLKPKSMMEIVDWAVENENIPLIMRLTVAIETLKTISDIEINAYANKALRLLGESRL